MFENISKKYTFIFKNDLILCVFRVIYIHNKTKGNLIKGKVIKMTKQELKMLENLAKEKVDGIKERGGLDTRNNDDDFFETSVWEIKDLIIAAYKAGKDSIKK